MSFTEKRERFIKSIENSHISKFNDKELESALNYFNNLSKESPKTVFYNSPLDWAYQLNILFKLKEEI